MGAVAFCEHHLWSTIPCLLNTNDKRSHRACNVGLYGFPPAAIVLKVMLCLRIGWRSVKCGRMIMAVFLTCSYMGMRLSPQKQVHPRQCAFYHITRKRRSLRTALNKHFPLNTIDCEEVPSIWSMVYWVSVYHKRLVLAE